MKYWYINCPECKQGRLFVMKNRADRSLFLLCEECESAWKDPDKTTDLQKNVAIGELQFEFALESDIRRAGWFQYTLHEASE